MLYGDDWMDSVSNGLNNMDVDMNLNELKTLFSVYVNDPYFGYFSEATATTFLNNALIQAQRRLLKMHAAYYSVCASTPLIIGQSQYSLPDDFLALFDIWIDLDNSTPPPTSRLEFIPLSKRHDFAPTNGTPTHFYMLKNSLNVVVPPDDTQTLEIVYAPKAPAMTTGTDIPDIPEQYHEFLVLLAAETALMVDDRVSSLVDDRLEYYDKLISANEQRIQSQPRYIIEVS